MKIPVLYDIELFVRGIRNKLRQQRKNFENRKMFLNNEIFLDGKRIFELDEKLNIKLDIKGKGNTIKLNCFDGTGGIFIDLRVDNFIFEFGKNNTINNPGIFITGYNAPGSLSKSSFVIGDNNLFNGAVEIVLPTTLDGSTSIGNNNVFARNIHIKGITDHLIYDLSTMEQINKERGISIGDNNWICEDTVFLNKARILNNCVVGMRSIVNKEFTESNVLIAGAPADIRKTNIGWSFYVNDSYRHTNKPKKNLQMEGVCVY